MILTKDQIERIKWQYSDATQVKALLESHEDMRLLLKEAFKRAEFFPQENSIRLKCLDALEK